MAKFCSNCGKPINESDKHCSACGTKVNGVSSQDIATFVGEKVVGLGDKIVTDFIEPQEATVGVEVRKDQGFIDYFFRKDGRLNRKPYIIRLLAIEITKFIALFILWYLLSDIYGNLSMINSILFFLVGAVFCYSNFCINIRRQQDLEEFNENKNSTVSSEDKTESSFFMSKFVLFVDCLFLLFDITGEDSTTNFKAILFAVSACIFIFYLCVKKGTQGPNQYGPDPLEHESH